MNADTPIRFIKGIGDARAKSFEKLGVFTARDLIYLMPRRYEDRRALKKIADVADGEVCAVFATVSNEGVQSRSRSGVLMVKALASDETGDIYLTFFNNKWIKNSLKKGTRIKIYGKFTFGLYGRECVNPSVQVAIGKNTDEVVAVYPLVSTLTQNVVRRAVKEAVSAIEAENNVLTNEIEKQFGLMSKRQALYAVHFPSTPEEAIDAKKRLAFEELLVFQLAVRLLKKQSIKKSAKPIKTANTKIRLFFESLPFELTDSQKRVIKEIFADMEKDVPMQRLLQGDVGSGKTVVAAAAIYLAVKNGHQAAMMAPTEILAKQHYDTLTRILAPFDIKVELFCGAKTLAQKNKANEKLKNGEIQVAVGTSALIQGKVEFCDLALAVTDEQHRFGVEQRSALIGKSQKHTPHTLVMSATPIPRTLNLIFYGDLDISTIDTLPKGRQKTETYAVDNSYRERINAFINKEILSGGSVYVVCPLVEENEESTRVSAEQHAKELQKTFPNTKIGLLHGKMSAKAKQQEMERFSCGETKILVSTTVVEVGVDVPQASLMVVENAECFGLSSLHQLRGRIGRGSRKSYCILVYDKQTPRSKERLEIMCKTANGFEIAEADLKQRGPGDFFGNRQSGGMVFKTASVADMGLLLQTSAVCDKILTQKEGERYAPLIDEAYKLLESAVAGNTLN